ncbi:MAG: hypothetical protein RXQ73_03660 [Caldivirga sp.]|uniref:hypothetical protein n=1 Tax=Caldivirga sp. MU80 TaxID=1650354 RepID=UPI00082BB46A|nr:hypothetical protein [Caldivirga sp. MU80]
MLRGFRRIQCTEEEYYDEFGRELDIPYYVEAECYAKEYEWGTATVSARDLDVAEYFGDLVPVYLNVVGFPPLIVNRITEDNDGYDAVIEATINYGKASVIYDSGSIPVDYNLEIECKKEELVKCIDNVSSWINDYIEYLTRVAEDYLRRSKPE